MISTFKKWYIKYNDNSRYSITKRFKEKKSGIEKSYFRKSFTLAYNKVIWNFSEVRGDEWNTGQVENVRILEINENFFMQVRQWDRSVQLTRMSQTQCTRVSSIPSLSSCRNCLPSSLCIQARVSLPHHHLS